MAPGATTPSASRMVFSLPPGVRRRRAQEKKPPVQIPPNEPNKPPVEEPGDPPEPTPPPGRPPVEEPPNKPRKPPVEEPPPKDPDRKPPEPPPVRAAGEACGLMRASARKICGAATRTRGQVPAKRRPPARCWPGWGP